MAGIGFVLRKLLRKDNLTGIMNAYFHGMLASSGPWVVTVLALGSLYLFSKSFAMFGEQDLFRAIVLYNFCFSLVFSAPVTVIATRYLADHIYFRDLDTSSAMLMHALNLTCLPTLPIVLWFYGYYIEMTVAQKVLAIFNFYLILCIWIASVFISALKTYRGVSYSFIAGMIIGVYCAVELAQWYASTGMLIGFNIGLSVILGSIVAFVYAEYPKRFKNPSKFYSYFARHWELALGGLFYTLGIWVDKWIMWFSQDAEMLPAGFLIYPYYDSSMFLAYLTVLPAMAMFLVTQETSFFEYYVKFYKDILEDASFGKIQENQHTLFSILRRHARNILVLQLGIAVSAILMAPKIFDMFSINYIQLGIFRLGVLGASFQIFSLFLLIINSYFENRRTVLLIQLFFFVSNALLTYLMLSFGFPYYGLGYCISSIITFILSAFAIERFLNRLPYHTFITTNDALRYRESID